MESQTRPEPMNASPHHSKVKVSLTLANSIFVAGSHVSGKMEMECRADNGLGINVMMVELFAIQELTSRDHSATSTFLHSRRLFQGPGLPPSNAVQAYPLPGSAPVPPNYYQARRGVSTFLFRIPIPSSSPSSIVFGSGLARVKYEVRASVGVAWKGDKRLVTDKKELDLVESFEEDFTRTEPEGVIVGEYGKIWMHGRVVGGVVVAGESACVDLQVKNHSQKKNTGITVTLTRTLHLPVSTSSTSQKPPIQISDTLTSVAFRGQEYIIPPGAEGVASLVFDVPHHARGVRGGPFEGDNPQSGFTEALFEVRCSVGIKMNMGIGSKDIHLELPVTAVHPSALPDLPTSQPTVYPYPPTPPDPIPASYPMHYLDGAQSPYAYPALPVSPHPYIDQGHVLLSQPTPQVAHPYQQFFPPTASQPYYFPPPPSVPAYISPLRPSSAGPSSASDAFSPDLSVTAEQWPSFSPERVIPLADPEEGKGELAARITQHLRLSSRHRSVSPQSHRFPLPASNPVSIPLPRTGSTAPAFTTNPSASSPTLQAVVHSPRPLLSPKQSYTVDPITHNSLPKSERVEELERMAAEVEAQNKDLSADIPKSTDESNINKTLPGPPVPTRKDRFLSPPVATRTPVETYFTAVPEPDSVSLDDTPATPMLTAVSPAKVSRADLLGGPGPDRTESGLDALERRLLAEVGTRKMDPNDKRPDVRSVLPIPIPNANNVPERLNDSAISSLTLADHDSDGRTHKAGKSITSEELGRDQGKGAGNATVPSAEREGDRKNGKKKDRTKDGEAHRSRKSAKGRVTAWLGAIDPGVPPDILPSPSSDLDIEPIALSTSESKATPAGSREHPDENVMSAPNPRSSGFVPIGTHKRDTFQRSPARRAAPLSHDVVDNKPHEPGSRPSPAGAKPPTLPPISSPNRASQPIAAANNHSLPLSLSDANRVGTSPQKTLKSPAWQTDDPPNKKFVHLSPRLPAFPPPSDSEVKYDVRSARGGRGGKVTAVASFWASGAVREPNSKDQVLPGVLRTSAKAPPPAGSASNNPEPKFVDLTGRSGRHVIKSPSVPAVVSSHATPTLSSTASLARPSPFPDKSKPSVKVQPAVYETDSERGKAHHSPQVNPAKPAPTGDFAFGQARLRDLIKRYQGQT